MATERIKENTVTCVLGFLFTDERVLILVMSSAAPAMATSHGFLEPSRNVQALANQMAVDDCESTSDELVKFFMSQNISLDVIKNSHFQTLMKTIAQRGQQSCMFLENSSVIEKSLWKFENEIKQYMQMNDRLFYDVLQYERSTARQVCYRFLLSQRFIFFEANLSKQDVENASADVMSDSSSKVWDDIPNLLDTLVPSAGYLGLAMDKASALLKIYSKHEPFKFEPILEYFKEWRDDYFEPVQDLICYFNPKLDAYCTKSTNPFADFPMSECEAIIPLCYGPNMAVDSRCCKSAPLNSLTNQHVTRERKQEKKRISPKSR
ncbi:hypothetical protein V2J09_002153 [Rumex salicifolius]